MMTDERLVAFLYILMRDRLPAGAVAKILEQHLVYVDDCAVYTNEHLEAYAREVATALRARVGV